MNEENARSITSRPYLPYSQSLAIGLLTLWLMYACALILSPFVAVLAWAFALAVAIYPLATWLGARIPNRSVSAFLAVSIGALSLCLPTVWVTRLLVHTSIENISSLITESGLRTWLDPTTAPARLVPLLTWLEQTFHIQKILTDTLHTIADQLPQLLAMSLVGLVQFLLTLFSAFFFIRDSAVFFRFLQWLVPLSPDETERAAWRVLDTVHACLFGILLMALLQGALGVFIFWWLKLPQPTLWGIVMGLLAIIPYLGAFIVWIPTAFVLALHGEWVDALILVGWGGLVIGLSDNFLYPVLVGKRLHYHSLLIFFFLLGGIVVFGSAGVVLGPIILSITHGMIELWHQQRNIYSDPLTPYPHPTLSPDGAPSLSRLRPRNGAEHQA